MSLNLNKINFSEYFYVLVFIYLLLKLTILYFVYNIYIHIFNNIFSKHLLNYKAYDITKFQHYFLKIMYNIFLFVLNIYLYIL